MVAAWHSGRRDPPRAGRGRGAPLGAGPDARRLPAACGGQRLDRRLRRAGGHAGRDGGGRAWPGLRRSLLRGPDRPRRRRLVAFMDCDGSLDPAELPRVAGAGAARRGRPGAGRAPPRARRLAACTRGWPTARSRRAAAPLGRAAARPGADARGAARGAARPGHPRPPLRLAAGDGAAGRRGRVADRGAGRGLPRARRAGPRSPARCGARPAPCATWRWRCDERGDADGHRQGSRCPAGQDPAMPAVHARAGGGAGRGRAGDTLTAMAGARAPRADGRAGWPTGPVAAPGFDVDAPGGTGAFGRSAGGRIRGRGRGPARRGHGHPAAHARPAGRRARPARASRAWTPCLARPPMAATGASASTAPMPRRVRGCADVRARDTHGPARAAPELGLRTAELDWLVDVDDDRRCTQRWRRTRPRRGFAAALARVRPRGRRPAARARAPPDPRSSAQTPGQLGRGPRCAATSSRRRVGQALVHRRGRPGGQRRQGGGQRGPGRRPSPRRPISARAAAAGPASSGPRRAWGRPEASGPHRARPRCRPLPSASPAPPAPTGAPARRAQAVGQRPLGAGAGTTAAATPATAGPAPRSPPTAPGRAWARSPAAAAELAGRQV